MFRRAPLFALVTSAAIAAPLASAERNRDSGQTAPAVAVIRVSPETTRYTAPVDADGYVDFLVAMNQHFGKSIPLSENAAELILQAIGPAGDRPNTMNDVRQALGMPPVGTGPFIVPIQSGAPSGADLEKKMDAVVAGPWSEKDFPQFAAVLKRNTEPLALVHKAVQRPKYYRPLTLPKPGASMVSILLPDIQMHRDIARLLKSRAMLSINNGQFDAAQQDLYDMHRLARCTGKGMTLIEGLVGIAIDAMASQGDNVWANQPGVTVEQLNAYRQQIAALPPTTDLTDMVDHCERAFLLDIMQKMARGTMLAEESRSIFTTPQEGSQPRSMIDVGTIVNTLSLMSVDWNVAMADANAFYDGLIAAGRAPTRSERSALYDEWEQRLKQEKVRFAGSGGTQGATAAVLRFAFGSSKSRGHEMGSMLNTLLMPSVKQATAAEDAGRLRIQMTQVMLALAEYRALAGHYPERLEELSPQFLPEIPTDVFSGNPLHYGTDGASYQLYSVGRNGRDDGGMAGKNGADDMVFSDPAVP